MKKLQAKDIPDEVMLDIVRSLENVRRAWVNVRGFESFVTSSASRYDIENLWPSVPPKVILAKLKRLVKRGIISGCACGCRGDFKIVKTEELSHMDRLSKFYPPYQPRIRPQNYHIWIDLLNSTGPTNLERL